MSDTIYTGRSAGRPRGRRRADTEAAIVAVARRLFAERGYAQTTVKDVAQAAGLSHAAIYSYYANKQALYGAAIASAQAELLPDYMRAMSEGANLREKIAGVLMASAHAHDADRNITGLLAAVPMELRRHPELLEQAWAGENDVLAALMSMFDEARANGELSTCASNDELLAVLLGGGVGVALFQYGVQSADLSGAMQLFVDLLFDRVFRVQ